MAADPTVVGRVVALLTAFAPGDNALGAAELARRTGLPKSSVHRLSRQLVEHGLLEPADTEVRLGLRLFEIGQLATRQRGLVEAARPHLVDLRAATGNTVHLAVLEGNEVVYLDVLPGPDAPRLPSRTGGRFPAHATAVGKAILANSEPPTADMVIHSGLMRVSERTITAPGVLRKQLATIRAEGIAHEREESGAGVVCAASPLLGPDGLAVAAISIAGWSNRMNVQRVGPAVRTVALALSRMLGPD